MMTVRMLLDEYDLDITDIRWYLSAKEVERVLTYKDKPEELIQQYFTGEISAKLYNWDETYLDELQSGMDRNLIDETLVRESFQEALMLKKERLALTSRSYNRKLL